MVGIIFINADPRLMLVGAMIGYGLICTYGNGFFFPIQQIMLRRFDLLNAVAARLQLGYAGHPGAVCCHIRGKVVGVIGARQIGHAKYRALQMFAGILVGLFQQQIAIRLIDKGYCKGILL